jgi:transcriptional regulator with XRE-family HTH domain
MRERVRVSTAEQGREVLSTLLRSHRILSGLSQEELADRSGLSVRAISNIERARTTHPYASSIRLLADALELSDQSRAELLRAARSESGNAADLADAIKGFLDALGVPAEQIPKALQDEAALYRSVLAERQVLVVLLP